MELPARLWAMRFIVKPHCHQLGTQLGRERKAPKDSTLDLLTPHQSGQRPVSSARWTGLSRSYLQCFLCGDCVVLASLASVLASLKYLYSLRNTGIKVGLGRGEYGP